MGLNEKTESRVWGKGTVNESVLKFRIELGLGVQVPVEMRGRGFRGGLQSGDQVEVLGPWRRGETLRPKWLRNLDTQERVQAVGIIGRREIVLSMVALSIFIIFVLYMVLSDRHNFEGPPAGFESMSATTEAQFESQK